MEWAAWAAAECTKPDAGFRRWSRAERARSEGRFGAIAGAPLFLCSAGTLSVRRRGRPPNKLAKLRIGNLSPRSDCVRMRSDRGARMGNVPIEFATVEEAVEELRQGRQIVLVDDEDRENEGDLALVAEKITPEADQFHGQVWPRADLPGADRGPLRRVAPAADVADQYLGAGHGVHGVDRRAAAERPPASARPTAPPRFSQPSIRPRARRTWRGPATSFRCARSAAACWCARGRRKLPWTWRASPGCIPPA